MFFGSLCSKVSKGRFFRVSYGVFYDAQGPQAYVFFGLLFSRVLFFVYFFVLLFCFPSFFFLCSLTMIGRVKDEFIFFQAFKDIFLVRLVVHVSSFIVLCCFCGSKGLLGCCCRELRKVPRASNDLPLEPNNT